jgi:hypothetical protein
VFFRVENFAAKVQHNMDETKEIKKVVCICSNNMKTIEKCKMTGYGLHEWGRVPGDTLGFFSSALHQPRSRDSSVV